MEELSGVTGMVQAAVLDCQFLDLFPPFDDGGVAAKAGIGWCDVADALVVALVGHCQTKVCELTKI